MQQTNNALQELNNTRVVSEADQVKEDEEEKFVFSIELIWKLFRDEKKRWPTNYLDNIWRHWIVFKKHNVLAHEKKKKV